MTERHPLTRKQTHLVNAERAMDISDRDPNAWQALNEEERALEQRDTEVERLRSENAELRARAANAERRAELAERALKARKGTP